ncbi:MAG: type II and III secretion system protein family protein, partial [Steroidobacteraceae bacterium]
RVLSVVQVDGNKLLVLGEMAGVSAVHVWTRDGGHRRYVFDVLEFNGEGLYRQVQQLLAGTRQISARLVGDRIVLEGQRVSEGDRERAAAVVKAFPGRVFDFIDRVGWDAMIHLQVSILEVRHSAMNNLGIRWDNVLQGPAANINSAGEAGRHGYLDWTARLGSAIDLLRQRGEARIVAEPTLSCRSGGEAHFVAGGELPVPVTNGQGTPSVQYHEYGVILDVKPVADDAGNVFARVETEVSDIDRSVQVLGVPGILKRHSNTEVNVRTGETIVIAGLVDRSSNVDRHGLPLLGAIPGLSPLFQSHSRELKDSELVVLITPRIVSARPANADAPDPGLQQLNRAEHTLREHGAP